MWRSALCILGAKAFVDTTVKLNVYDIPSDVNYKRYSTFFIPPSWDQLFSVCCNLFQKQINLSLLGLIRFNLYTPPFAPLNAGISFFLHVNCLSSNIHQMLFSSHKQPNSILFCCFYHAATFNSVLGWQKPKAKLESTKYMLLWLIDWTKSKTQGDYL